jgi:hypothetical protein
MASKMIGIACFIGEHAHPFPLFEGLAYSGHPYWEDTIEIHDVDSANTCCI